MVQLVRILGGNPPFSCSSLAFLAPASSRQPPWHVHIELNRMQVAPGQKQTRTTSSTNQKNVPPKKVSGEHLPPSSPVIQKLCFVHVLHPNDVPSANDSATSSPQRLRVTNSALSAAPLRALSTRASGSSSEISSLPPDARSAGARSELDAGARRGRGVFCEIFRAHPPRWRVFLSPCSHVVS